MAKQRKKQLSCALKINLPHTPSVNLKKENILSLHDDVKFSLSNGI